ncbi:hypothetical protein TWF718_007275 [Orbilia javanica]|uniref:Uncharacterized protein n=1 Tax=Orbilia javanica TaxID=47235 RepID=A0AAN8RDR5_9PEZI
MIVASCQMMKRLSISLEYDGRRGVSDAVRKLENQFKSEGGGDSKVSSQPHLTDLSIELVDGMYQDYTEDMDMEPTYCVLRVLCDILHGPAKTVKKFAFKFSGDLYPEYESELPLVPLTKPLLLTGPGLDLPMVKTLSLGVGMKLPECCEILLWGFFHLDEAKVKRMEIYELGYDESVGLKCVDFLSPFPNLETAVIGEATEPCCIFARFKFVEGIFDAKDEGELGSVQEIRIKLRGGLHVNEKKLEDIISRRGSSDNDYQVRKVGGSRPLSDGRFSVPEYLTHNCGHICMKRGCKFLGRRAYFNAPFHFIFSFDPKLRVCSVSLKY